MTNASAASTRTGERAGPCLVSGYGSCFYCWVAVVLAWLFSHSCLVLTEWPNNRIGCRNGSVRVAAPLSVTLGSAGVGVVTLGLPERSLTGYT